MLRLSIPGLCPFPGDSQSSRRAAPATLHRLARSTSTSPAVLVGCISWWTHRSKRGCFPLPLFGQHAWVNQIEGQTPRQGQKTGARATTKRGSAKSGSIPECTVRSPSTALGSLKPESFPLHTAQGTRPAPTMWISPQSNSSLKRMSLAQVFNGS